MIPYSGKLSREETFVKFGEKDNICGENFCRLLAFAVPKDTTPPNFTEKTFTNSHKTAKVFSLKSFPLYGTECFRHDYLAVTQFVCLPCLMVSVLLSVQQRVITQVVTEPVCFTLHCMDHFPLGCQVTWLQLVAMVPC